MWGSGIRQSAARGSLYQPGSVGSGTPLETVYSEKGQRNSRRVWVSRHRIPLGVLRDSTEHISGGGSETQTPGVKGRE